MIKRFVSFILLDLFITASYSQPSAVTVSIKPDSTITSGMLTFHCIISNPTNKNYRYFDFDPTCVQRRYSPEFWTIAIRKDTTEYFDISLEFVLRQRINDPEVKLHKHSIRTFDFCLDFSKLSIGSDLSDVLRNKKAIKEMGSIKEYINKSYGNYEIQIFYLKYPFDRDNPLSLISDWTKIEYAPKSTDQKNFDPQLTQ
jgi:hypothetical protein